MKFLKGLLLWACSLSALAAGSPGIQPDLSVYGVYSNDRQGGDSYFENWTRLDLSHERVRAGLQFEAHTPPLPYSQDTSGMGLYQRYIRYGGERFQLTLGNFYSMLGMGLVFRSFENRSIRWDTNVDGFLASTQTGILETKVFAGKPRDRSGVRLDPLAGVEADLSPMTALRLGTTWLGSSDEENKLLQRASFLTSYSGFLGSLYGEFAFRDDGRGHWNDGHAFYSAADFFISSLSFRLEIKDYDHFHLAGNSLYDYNNPPTVVREHLFSLLNRHQLVINADDETGFLLESVIPVSDLILLTLNTNRSRNSAGDLLYTENYAQMDVSFPSDISLTAAGGLEGDREATYLNAVFSASAAVDERRAVKFLYEHQHVAIRLTDRQFYSQILHLEFSQAPLYTVSILAERSTDQYSERSIWLGVEGDMNFADGYDLSVFAGNRREGKVCAGGVCVYKPEFQGIELIFQIRL